VGYFTLDEHSRVVEANLNTVHLGKYVVSLFKKEDTQNGTNDRRAS
jgi:hypothetical protein